MIHDECDEMCLEQRRRLERLFWDFKQKVHDIIHETPDGLVSISLDGGKKHYSNFVDSLELAEFYSRQAIGAKALKRIKREY